MSNDWGKQKSYARQRAEMDTGDGGANCISLPRGMKFWQPKEGLNTVDILPYKTGKGNPFVPEGEWYYERTFWTYRNIGANPKLQYIALAKTFNERDPVQDFIREEARKANADTNFLKELNPKKRQLFLIFDHNKPEDGIQAWEYSYHNFGQQLNDTIELSPESRGWDQFYFPDTHGSTLEISFKKVQKGTYSFLEASRIDFMRRRESLPDNLVNHGHCIDSFLVKLTYDQLRRVFLQLPEDVALPPEGSGAPPVRSHGDQQQGGSAGGQSSAGSNSVYERSQQRSDQQQQEQQQSQSRSSESRETINQRITDMGRLAFENGQKSSGNPYEPNTERHFLWAGGWMAGMEAKERGATTSDAEPAAKSEAPKNDPPVRVTVASLGFQKYEVFQWKGASYTFSRAEDDYTLAALDDRDEMVRGIPASEVVKGGASGGGGNGGGHASNGSPNGHAANTTVATTGGDAEKKWDEEWPS